MAVSFGTIGTATGGTSSTAPSYPASIAAGDLIAVFCAWGNSTDAQPATPSGFLAPANNDNVGGSGAFGVDSGNRHAKWWYRVADGTESGTVTVNNGAGSGGTDVIAAVVARFTKTLDVWELPVCVGGGDTSSGTAYSVAAGSDPGGLSGDHVIVVSSTVPDTATYSSVTLTWSGTFGDNTITSRQTNAFTNGADVRINSYSRDVTGTSGGTPTFAATLSASGAGAATIVRLRDAKLARPSVAVIQAVARGVM